MSFRILMYIILYNLYLLLLVCSMMRLESMMVDNCFNKSTVNVHGLKFCTVNEINKYFICSRTDEIEVSIFSLGINDYFNYTLTNMNFRIFLFTLKLLV